jgi:two-component system, chemotaxis family, protein-glutamate methylesterase/glutaminase
VPKKNVVVIGGSAGGLEGLRTLVAGLPEDLPASLFVVLHTSPHAPGLLAAILDRAGPLPAALVGRRERIEPGRIYVAPPDYHIVLEPGVVRTTRGPKENRFRPAVDPLFRSAAQVYGPRAVGVIMSGGLDDGTAGLRAIKQLGGTAIVQDPDDALFPSMPESALSNVDVDYKLPATDIALLLARLASEPVDGKGGIVVPDDIDIEVNIAREDHALDAGVLKLGEPSSFACPECHGVLLRMKQAGPLRFRCHTGHAYTLDSLVSEVGEAVDEAVWNAIRALDESVMLITYAAEHLRESGDADGAARLFERADDAKRRSEHVRRAALRYAEVPVTADTGEQS